METRRLRIRGHVQGVFYRNWMIATAHDLGLTGWVRNRADGSVEALATGTREQIDALVAACQQGPGAARVDSVEVEPAAPEAVTGFEKRATV